MRGGSWCLLSTGPWVVPVLPVSQWVRLSLFSSCCKGGVWGKERQSAVHDIADTRMVSGPSLALLAGEVPVPLPWQAAAFSCSGAICM